MYFNNMFKSFSFKNSNGSNLSVLLILQSESRFELKSFRYFPKLLLFEFP